MAGGAEPWPHCSSTEEGTWIVGENDGDMKPTCSLAEEEPD